MPPLARLALAYAPARAREDWLTLLALDARLGVVVRTAREPVLAQLRLAWWRDRFAADAATWPKGEPLLARLATWPDAASLSTLVDGWEALLGEPPLGEEALTDFANGRAAALGAIADRLGCEQRAGMIAGRRWALAEVALHGVDRAERECARNLLDAAARPDRTARALRPVAILSGLCERALRRGDAEALSGPGALFAAIRLGITGG